MSSTYVDQAHNVPRIGLQPLVTTWHPIVVHVPRYSGARMSKSSFETLCGRWAWPLRLAVCKPPNRVCAECHRRAEAQKDRRYAAAVYQWTTRAAAHA